MSTSCGPPQCSKRPEWETISWLKGEFLCEIHIACWRLGPPQTSCQKYQFLLVTDPLPVPDCTTCCQGDWVHWLQNISAKHSTHTLTGRIHHLLLEMGISCQAMFFGFNVLPSAWMHYNIKISGISPPRVAIPVPDPAPCQQYLVLPVWGKDSKKPPQTQQTQSQNDGSGQVPARKNSSSLWRGDLLVRFSQLQSCFQ